ncbi:hypothetical protein [Acutalibacter muris]|uniref:hypothetical protein n=1 Tax=Acutalibacter muris TaxID=1796620 RepID=UPI0025E74E4D|nr:hypothetical protein [Acutalibacter muris]
MRMMQYELKLFERGYVVTNGPMRDYDQAYEDKCLPIKLTVLECQDVGYQDIDFADAGINKDDWGYREDSETKAFREAYRDVLRGKTDWYLYSFEVAPECLILDFYNPELNHGDYLILDGFHNFKLQFDIPGQNGAPASSRYTVDMWHHRDSTKPSGISDRTHVTEYQKGVRRELDFERRGDDDYVCVTEYVD